MNPNPTPRMPSPIDIEEMLVLVEKYFRRSWLASAGKIVILFSAVLLAITAFIATFRTASGLDGSLRENRKTIATQVTSAVAPSAEQTNTLANKLETLSTKVAAFGPKTPKAEFQAVSLEIAVQKESAQKISENLVQSAEILIKTAGKEFDAVVADLGHVEQPPGSVMEGIEKDPKRNPRWYNGKRYPNLVEVYVHKDDPDAGTELRKWLGERGAFVPPPGLRDSQLTNAKNHIYYYHLQDEKLAMNVASAIRQFFENKKIEVNISPPEMHPNFNRMDVQIGQVAVYIGDIHKSNR